MSATSPVLRAEGFTERTGDIVLSCSGGVPTPAGQTVPVATIVVATTATITSKITDPNPGNAAAFNEALLLVDEPNTPFFDQADPIYSSPVLACGSTGGTNFAPNDIGNQGVCTIMSDGLPSHTYNGTSGHPNVFQGRQLPNSGNSSIQFTGVPFDPPGPGRTRILRITNIRVNGVAVTGGTVTSSSLPPPIVQASVFLSPGIVATISAPATVTTGTFLNGIGSVTTTTATPWPQCSASTRSGGTVTITEGFPGAFSPRNWAQTQANGNYYDPATKAWRYSFSSQIVTTSDLNQNVAGAIYFNESGFEFPSLASAGDPKPMNAPQGSGVTAGAALPTSQNFVQNGIDTGLIEAGAASTGTRLQVVFASIPTGSNATIPAVVSLNDAGFNTTGFIVYIAGADASGAGGVPTPGGTDGNGNVTLSEPGPTSIFYEVMFSNPVGIDLANIPITLHLIAGAPQPGVMATASAGFASAYSANSNAGLPQPMSTAFPLPRFVNGLSSPMNLFSFIACSNVVLTKSHIGNFTQGQNGVVYTLAVKNTGAAATSGPINVNEAPPPSLTATSFSGTGWTCTSNVFCTRSDALPPGASYPTLSFTGNVSASSPFSLVNTATAYGNYNTSVANDPTTVLPGTLPDLIITKTHVGDFTQGQVGGMFTITVQNAGSGATTGLVTVSDALPLSYMRATSIAGIGWNCVLASLVCTRNDVLPGNSSYPPINVIVNVLPTAYFSNNQATVSGGGDNSPANNTAIDNFNMLLKPNLVVALAHTGNFSLGQIGAAYSIVIGNQGFAPTSGLVAVNEQPPSGFTITSISGDGWSCTQPAGPCTRSDVASDRNGVYPPIRVVGNVAPNASPSFVNEVTVSGGGEIYTPDSIATDATTVLGVTPTTISVSAAPSDSVFGHPLSLTATVSPSSALGKVTFSDGGTALATVPLFGGVAQLSTLALPTGVRKVWARYSGDSRYAPSLSTPIAITVHALPATQFVEAAGSPISIGTESASPHAVVADFNHDGRADIAITSSNSFGSFTILLGNGDGTFTSSYFYTSGGGNVSTLATGDFNGDGNADLVVSSGSSYALDVFLGDGRGYFTRANGGPFNAAGAYLPGLAVADFDGDGNADVAAGALILLGDGSGNLKALEANYQTVGFPSIGAVKVGDFNGDSRPDLAIPTANNTVAVLLNDGHAHFTRQEFAAGVGTANIAIADFNGDGTEDIVAVDGAHLFVLLGDGGGNFSPANEPPSAVDAFGTLVTGDFNGDGNQDVAIGHMYLGKLSIFLGDGKGGLSARGDQIPTGSAPVLDVVGDFNGDGRTDLVAPQYYNHDVDIFLGSGSAASAADLVVSQTHSASFAQRQIGAQYSVTVTNSGNAASAGAVTVSEQIPQWLIATSLGGTGWTCTQPAGPCNRSDSLSSGASYPVITLTVNVASNAPSSLVSTALVSGGAELIVTNNTATDQTVVNPTGTATSVALTSSANPSVLGSNLVLTANVSPSSAQGTVTFYDGGTVLGIVGLGGGKANLTVALPSGNRMLSVYYAGNASFDASHSSQVQTVRAAPASGFILAPGSPLSSVTSPNAVTQADFNADGKLDLAVSNYGSNTVNVLLGDGNGGFTAATGSPFAVGVGPYMVASGDFNGDGRLDMAVPSVGDGKVTILLGNAAGGFTPAAGSPYTAGNTPTFVAAGDLNGDGFVDLAVANSNDTSLTLMFGNGAGQFSVTSFPQPNVSALVIGDFNGDGKMDLAASSQQGSLTILLGDGRGGFIKSNNSPFTAGTYANSLVTADFNGDSNLDIAVVSTYPPATVSVFLGDGHGGFVPAAGSPMTPSAGAAHLDVGDFNGDGVPDLAVAGGAGINILIGDGRGSFTPAAYSPIPSNATWVSVADFNRDGRADLATLVQNTNLGISVALFLGSAPDLVITATHHGDFTQGQTGAAYTITVANSGNATTSGPIAVADILPVGLILTGLSGSGWNCVAAGCTRNDALAPGASFPAITVLTQVSPDAPLSLTNVARVSGGGESDTSNDSANDLTVVRFVALPDLKVSISHAGHFSQGQTNAAFAVSASNIGAAPTTGTATVTVTLPPGLTLVAMAGSGWNCPAPGSSCSRQDVLAAGDSFPLLTVTVNITANAPSSVVTIATVSGGGEINTSDNSASDSFRILSRTPDKVGVFRSGYFWLEDVNGDQQFTTPQDRAFAFGGIAGDIPITGDWNGSGTSKVGIYRPSNGLFILDTNGNGVLDAGDYIYNLGVGAQAGDVPVVGDWNGSGTTKVGLFRQGFFWILDTNGNGVFEQGVDNTYAFGGVSGDVPVVGDWNGSGTSKIGLFRLGFYWILDANGNGTLDSINATGGDQAFAYGGIAGDVPVIGDWNGSGSSKVGVFRQGFFWVLDANGNHSFDGTGTGQDLAFPFGGITGDIPVTGKW